MQSSAAHDPTGAVRVTTAVSTELTIRLTGELDLSTISALVDELHAVLALGPVGPVVVDLTGLAFCDVAGARALARLAEAVAGHGDPFHVRGASPRLRWLFHQIGAELLLSGPASP
ncbi:STAS domain-containing protein [Couchioplanes azureus]|uniref:STAS domain-containing protein n=1 Tax=Couchioplanes caeruleus TaxID=56438 RepID=UPI001E3D752C|nr:STAS domain-containing protein [Couchioplanes caeruleus]